MGVGPLNVSYCYFGTQCEIEKKKTGCNFKMTLWDAKMPLIILHFVILLTRNTILLHLITIYIILCMPRSVKIRRKNLTWLRSGIIKNLIVT